MHKAFFLLVLSTFFLVGCTAQAPANNSTDNQDLIEDGVVMSLSYQGANKWEYKLAADLPNPCYTLSGDATVRESYPEQVTVTATIKDESTVGRVCAQVITTKEFTGEFSASEQATVELEVSR